MMLVGSGQEIVVEIMKAIKEIECITQINTGKRYNTGYGWLINKGVT